MHPIELTSSERVLLGVKNHEIGFKDYVPKPPEIKLPSESSEKKTVVQDSPNFSISPSQTLTYNRSLQNSMLSNLSIASTPTRIVNNSSPNLSLNSSSWYYQPTNSSPSTPANRASSSNNLRKRVSGNLFQSVIRDERSLNDYLQKFEENEEKLEIFKESEKKSNSSDIWNQSGREQSSPQAMNYQSADDSSVLGSDAEMMVDEHSGLSPLRSKENVSRAFCVHTLLSIRLS